MRRHAVTSVDIARQAGVSQATVSVVLNGARSNIRVSEATRQRVIAAAAELGYAPHSAAQALRRQRSGIVGYVPRFYRKTPYERPVPYLLSLHIARAAMLHGYHVIEVGAETDVSRAGGGLIQFLLNQRVDGVIFDAPESAEEVERFISRGVPAVQLMRPQTIAGAATITVDPTQGIDAAIDHLVALGHREIAFIGSGRDNVVDRARLAAFRAALRRHALAIPDIYMQFTDECFLEQGYTTTQTLLSLPRPPTALVTVGGDSLALGALRALHEARMAVPEEMSIVSYDDAFAAFLYPPLTSIAQPVQEIAERAVTLLMDRLDESGSGMATGDHLVMETDLVIRSSTGPPSGGRVREMVAVRTWDGYRGTGPRRHDGRSDDG